MGDAQRDQGRDNLSSGGQSGQGRFSPSAGRAAGHAADTLTDSLVDPLGDSLVQMDAAHGSMGPPVQMKKPDGWDDDDESTWSPDHYDGFSFQLVTDALDTLDLDANRPIANQWASMALNKGLVGSGDIRSTYKSSYDLDPDAFSVSQNVPMLDPLVVHAHISPDDEVALDGGVNLKWKHNEGGDKAANVSADIGSEVIAVAPAREHWTNNPEHDKAEADAIEKLEFKKKADLEKAEKAKAEAEAKASEKEKIDWGWKHLREKGVESNFKVYSKLLEKARKKPATMNKLLGKIEAAMEREESAPDV